MMGSFSKPRNLALQLESKEEDVVRPLELGDFVLTSCHVFGTIYGFQAKNDRAFIVPLGNWCRIICSISSLLYLPKISTPILRADNYLPVKGVEVQTKFGRGKLIGVSTDERILVVKLSWAVSYIPFCGHLYASNQFQIIYS